MRLFSGLCALLAFLGLFEFSFSCPVFENDKECGKFFESFEIQFNPLFLLSGGDPVKQAFKCLGPFKEKPIEITVQPKSLKITDIDELKHKLSVEIKVGWLWTDERVKLPKECMEPEKDYILWLGDEMIGLLLDVRSMEEILDKKILEKSDS